MTVNTTNTSTKHAQSIVQALRKNNVLPFTDILSAESITSKVTELSYRDRIFSPDITIYGLLSQAIAKFKNNNYHRWVAARPIIGLLQVPTF